MEKLEIIGRPQLEQFIGDDGNIYTKTDYVYSLVNKESKIISNQYACMVDLGNDHFAVGNIKDDVDCQNYDYFDMIHGDYKIKNPKLLWGVIRINRDSKGSVIPFSETMIVPYLYDRICGNNLNTATAYHNGKLTYLELDRYSSDYGKQLVPCILEHAVPFGVTYDEFAECSINGITGYLPRACNSRESINSYDLFEEDEVQALEEYYNGNIPGPLDFKTVSKYLELTGKDISTNNYIDHITIFQKIKR